MPDLLWTLAEIGASGGVGSRGGGGFEAFVPHDWGQSLTIHKVEELSAEIFLTVIPDLALWPKKRSAVNRSITRHCRRRDPL